MAKKVLVNVNGTLRNVKKILVNVDGVLKTVKKGLVNVNGILKQFWSSAQTPVIENTVELTKSGNYHNSTYPITLTGTKYHFSNADTFSYRFYRSASSSGPWTPMISETFTTNPSTGSSSNVTYQLTNSDFSEATTMYFKFEYTGYNTTVSPTLFTVSTSNIVSVMYLDIPSPPSGFPRITQSTIGASSNGESGTWSGSPNQYQWTWYYNDGSDKVLTYQGTPSISSSTLYGTVADVVSFSHGFKSGDTVSISGSSGLFNASNVSIYSVFTNGFSYTVPKTSWSFLAQYYINEYVTYNSNIYKALLDTPSRSTWSFSNNYVTGQYVDYNSQVYIANTNTPSVRPTWNSSTTYSIGQYVNYSSNVWQATATSTNQTPFIGSAFWTLINIYPTGSYWTQVNIYPGGSYWELQNGSVVNGGTATGPNYYEGSSSSPITYTISSFPATDYKTGTSLLGKTTKITVTASNIAAFSSTSSSTSRTIYGYPIITLGSPTLTSTTASITYIDSNMSVYDIDVKTGGSSISGYPKTNQANSSPISITGLSAGTSYTAYVTPKNADSPRVSGTQKTSSFTTPSPPGIPTITFSAVSATGFNVSWSASGATSYNVDVKNASSGLSIGIYPVSGTTAVSAVLSGLLNATQYTVYVTGVNSSGPGPQAQASQYTNAVLSYSGNSNTGGSAPSSTEHAYNSAATVAGNTGSLSRTYATWAGWSLATDGSGTTYGPGYTTTITMNQNRTLYARWTANVPGTPSVTVNRGPATATASTNYLVFSPVNFGTDTQSVLLEWGTTTSYSSGSSAVSTNGGSYTTPANLSANTTYYWRARGYNPVYNGYGNAQTGSVFIPQAQVAPFNGSVTVSLLSGTAGRVGATYYVSAASASGTPTPSISGYQWQYYSLATDTWISISGATSSQYTISYGSTSYSDIGRTLRCRVTFSNGVSPNLDTGSNSISVSNATITGVTATLSLTAPFIVYRVYGYNFQSISSKNSYGTTNPPTTTDANYTISATNNSTIPITRQSSNGGDLFYYRLEVGAYALLSGQGAFSGYITTNVVRNNATNRTNSPINIYGTGSA